LVYPFGFWHVYSGELAAMPDFAQVYNFLGSVFDPETSGHLQKLREMDPIDAETVCHFVITPYIIDSSDLL
jgi:hypothetical protein